MALSGIQAAVTEHRTVILAQAEHRFGFPIVTYLVTAADKSWQAGTRLSVRYQSICLPSPVIAVTNVLIEKRHRVCLALIQMAIMGSRQIALADLIGFADFILSSRSPDCRLPALLS